MSASKPVIIIDCQFRVTELITLRRVSSLETISKSLNNNIYKEIGILLIAIMIIRFCLQNLLKSEGSLK